MITDALGDNLLITEVLDDRDATRSNGLICRCPRETKVDGAHAKHEIARILPVFEQITHSARRLDLHRNRTKDEVSVVPHWLAWQEIHRRFAHEIRDEEVLWAFVNCFGGTDLLQLAVV